jgi:putative DNA primase/helicase
VVARFNSWTEISPSVTGVHIFVRGTLPEALKGEHFEAYPKDRFIAITGHRWPGTPGHLVAHQALLDHVMALARAQ